jgi:ribosome maturation factor RimP
MNPEIQVKAIENKVNEMLATDSGYFLVELSIKPTNNIKVFVDADQGASIDLLTKLNRSLYRHIEESGMFPNGDFSLEVSSPGLDEPLKLQRQYVKNIGRHIEVLKVDGVRVEGKLVSVNDDSILLDEEKGQKKKKEIVQHTIQTDQIKTTKIQIKF